ncbi:MAG: tRNA (adenosine(37)-N6)-dimethylallyltransferase MiaA [Fimbriimonadales bacterium]
MNPFAIAIMGPTASGKSDAAEELASLFGSRIVNADAFQVYRGFNIGTNKPANRERYDLIDILDPGDSFSAGQFVSLARPICAEYGAERRHSVVCGGTGLYVRALFDEFSEMSGHSEKLREKLRADLEHLGPDALLTSVGIGVGEPSQATKTNPVRLLRYIEKRLDPRAPSQASSPWQARRLKFGLRWDRRALAERIDKRVRVMVHNGWRFEVERLLDSGVQEHWPVFRAIGYREMANCVRGDISIDSAVERIRIRTRQYAKRQMTWLAKERGLRWLDGSSSASQIAGQIVDISREEQDGEVD